ncbi:uncharacterized protein PV09_06008 [Verruconis gallopava]|uniref:CFEM domain-containing protein n=1 Tax=Verruconis gallopava TaxID=253628 RepID=A0A0D2A754_9PEZI|nr:uncharacterized protein PV09_06008 [Verruconis gallopava]KIW02553.1 hypothetical protein PV09_06008 [Verruconis gallopava]
MSLCYSSCFSLYTSPASSACPNLLDLSCVCKNMEIFNSFSCCIQQKCGTGVMGETAWSWVEDMCGSYGGAPASQLSCSSGSGVVNTPIPTMATKTTANVVYTNAAGSYGSGGSNWPYAYSVPVVHASASASANPYSSSKLTSGASSDRSVKAFGVAGLLSLGVGALLLTAI